MRDQVGQVARLDPGRGLEVHLGALDGGGEDRLRRRHVGALELRAQHRREGGEERRQLRVRGGAARHPVAVAVPRLRRGLGVVGVRLDPGLRGRDQLLAGGDQLVDQAQLLRLGRLEAGALEQHAHQRVGDAEHPHGAGHATAAGQQAERHLGQAELHLRVVDDDPVVAGERDLESAAERGPVDRRHDRLAERLQPAEPGLDVLRHREHVAGVVGAGLHHARSGCLRRRTSSSRW